MLRWRGVVRRVSEYLGYGDRVYGVDGKVGWHSEGVSWEEANTFDRGKFNRKSCYESLLCAIAKAISLGICKPTQLPTNPSHIIRYSSEVGSRS